MGFGSKMYDMLDAKYGIDNAMKMARPEYQNAKTDEEKKKAMEKPITVEDLYRMSSLLGGAYYW